MKYKLKTKCDLSSVFKTIIKHLSFSRLKTFTKHLRSSSSGFTLVELLIYSVIFAVTVGLLSGILIAITGVQTRETAAFEITRQLQFVTQRMQHTIRDASVIGEVFEGTDPAAPCVQFCSIRLRVANPLLDPTIISSDIGGVYIQEGLNPRVALTTPAAQITALRFTRTANPEGLTTVAVDFGMVLNPDDPQLRVERNLQSGIAHVSAAVFNADILPDSSGSRNIGGTSLRWNNLILSGGVIITAPGEAGDHVGISMERGTTHGSSRIIQYYLPSTPRDRFGQRFEIGGTPILHLEGDMGDTARRAYFLNSNVGIGTNSPTSRLDIDGQIRIRGGAPAAGRVLTADATGLATWADPVAGAPAVTCPSGMIRVPPSLVHGTDGFCVDKYEAKNVGGVATSQAAGAPWVNIAQFNARAECIRAGKRLITEREWLAIAHNIERVSWNWSGGAPGSGQMSDGHSDNTPGNALGAAADTDPCFGTGDACSETVWHAQRRTYRLSNGETIWDFGGNVWEWVDQVNENEYPVQNSPAAGWVACSTAGDGICGNTLTTNDQWFRGGTILTRGFIRGGSWTGGTHAGAFTLDLYGAPTAVFTGIGFRCAR